MPYRSARLDSVAPAQRRFTRSRRRLAAAAFSGAFALAGVLGAMAPIGAWAANECGAGNTPTCTGFFGNGIEYEPSGTFSLTAGDGTIGGAAIIQAPNVFGFGQNGIAVGDLAFGALVGGAGQDATINITQFSTTAGGSTGAVVWTEGAGNDAVINNAGTATATGSGNLSLGHALVAISTNSGGDSGNATVNNQLTGVANGFNHGLVAFSQSGTASITNDGLVTTQNGDGMSTVDPIAGLLPSSVATGTNNGIINAGDDGMTIVAFNAVNANNNADGEINATDTGIHAYSVLGPVSGSNAGTINATNGDGVNTNDIVTGLVPTGTTVSFSNSGSITAGDDGMVISALGSATGQNLGDGVINATNNGLTVFSATSTASGTNENEINATNETGMSVTALLSSATANNSGTVNATNGSGVLASGLTGVTVNGGTGTVNAGDDGVIGTLFLTGTGDVNVTSGTTTATDEGVMGLNFGTGNTVVTSEGKTSAGGLTGVGGLAVDGNSTVNINADVDPPIIGGWSVASGDAVLNVADGVTVEATGLGLLSLSFGGGLADINAANSIVDSDFLGVVGVSLGGNVEIDTGTVMADGASGIIGAAIGPGNVDIATHGATTANGLFGVAGFAIGSGNVDIDLMQQTVTNTDQIGVFGLATSGGNVTILGEGSTVNADNEGIMGIAVGGGNVAIDSGTVTSTNDSGVLGISLGGDTTVTSHGKTSADNGLVGVGGFSLTGTSTVNVNADIDPPVIGSFSIAAGDADLNVADGVTVEATGLGLLALSFAGGDADIEAAPTSVVDSDFLGVVGVSLGGNVWIDTGTVMADAASGIIGFSLGGDVDIDTHGATTANGLFGVAGIAVGGGDVDIDLMQQTVTNTDQMGIFGLAIGGGNVDIEGEGSTVNADNEGIVGTAIGGGNVWIDAGLVNSTVDSGIVGTAIGLAGGNVDIDAHDDVNANGDYGIFGFSLTGNVDITVDPGSVITNSPAVGDTGTGIFGGAGGTVTIMATDTTVNAAETGVRAYGQTVVVDTGIINATNGSGAVGVAFGGDATVTTHDKTTADNGFVGAMGVSFGGSSTVTVGGDVDPPLFGMISATIGAGPAVGNVLPAVNVVGDWVGAIVANIGSGSATLNNDGNIDGGILGVGGLKIGSGGNVTINNNAGASITSDETAVGLVSFDPGAGVTNNAVLNNDGLIQGNSVGGAPVIGALTDGGLTVNNNATGLVQGELGAGGLAGRYAELAILALGAGPDDTSSLVNNDGTVIGRLVLLTGDTAGNVVNNSTIGSWSTSGENTIGLLGDDTINNTGLIRAGDVLVPGDFTRFDFEGGNDTFNNDGVVDASGGVGNFVLFEDLETFNNFVGVVGGLLTMEDMADDTDVTVISGLYDGGPASGTLAIDSFLDVGGGADRLYINGGATGFTDVTVFDLNAGFAAGYDPIGKLVVDVDGGVDGQPNFILPGGPIDKGFFDYDLFFVPEEGGVALTDDRWYLRNTPNERAYELPKMISGAQEVWHESAHTWLERTSDLRLYQFQDAAENAAVSPGLWVRGFGAWYDRDTSNTLETASGPVDADTSYSQDIYGVQAGIDFAVMDRSNPNGVLLLGLLGGYTWSNMDFDNTGSEADINGFHVGGYATYMYQGYFADLLVKADFHDVDYDTTFVAPDSSSSFDAFSIGTVLDTGYRFGVKYGTEGWFAEPGATLAYVHTDFDGTEMLNSDIDFDGADSLRGRLGARGGWTFLTGDRRTAIEPFVEASVWHEFLGDNAATLSSAAGSIEVGDDVGGTWGEVGGGINVVDLGSGFSGFVKGEYRFGNELDGAAVQGGLRINF